VTRRRVIAAVAVLLAAACTYLFLYEPAYGGLVSPGPATLVFAHRASTWTRR
jgi:hypothetical protein